MEEKIHEQRESIKLMKMSKGYQWEIRVIGTDENGRLRQEDIFHLAGIDSQLKGRWEQEKTESNA